MHLARLRGRGVRICGQVPQDVQDAALAAIDGPPEKKLQTGAGSSNNEVTHAISALMAHQREDLLLEKGWMSSITYEDVEPRGDPSVNNYVTMNDSQNLVGVKTGPVVQVLEQSSFPDELHRLKVLDLSETTIKCLPDSVFDLVGLTSLYSVLCRRRHCPLI